MNNRHAKIIHFCFYVNFVTIIECDNNITIITEKLLVIYTVFKQKKIKTFKACRCEHRCTFIADEQTTFYSYNSDVRSNRKIVSLTSLA